MFSVLCFLLRLPPCASTTCVPIDDPHPPGAPHSALRMDQDTVFRDRYHIDVRRSVISATQNSQALEYLPTPYDEVHELIHRKDSSLRQFPSERTENK